MATRRATLRWLGTGVLVPLLAVPAGGARAAVDEERKAGTVTRVRGTAVALQDAVPRPLEDGSPVYLGDVLSTGPDARLEIRMIDGGMFTLGERTTFMVIDYTFGGGTPNGLLRLLSGAVNAASGSLARFGDGRLVLEAESVTIGVRGTEFWVGELDGAVEVGLWQGHLSVSNRAGAVELTRPNDGTRVAGPAVAPNPPEPWDQELIARTRAMTSF
jgi:ferric-dicitrate binding protein FerR (iron transport regulator)